MFQGLPEEFPGHLDGADFVGVREVVARGRRGTANGGERAGVLTQRITDIIEADGVGELGEEQADDMAPRRCRARVWERGGWE